jgi:dihydrofolate synthase / folylpolyglutamate synthase
LSRQFSTVDDAFYYIGSFINFERSRKQTIRDYRLDRMRLLLKHFGNPENSFHSIHLAGSKGKGSTAIFIASALNALGERAGLYSSPHISDYRERITLGGIFFEDHIYIDAASKIAEGLNNFKLDDETGSTDPTTFELLTLMAFIIFKETDCSWGIVETGIGGRLDATNVITPAASVITNIEMEHADILGDTLEKIASEKAGIIKHKVPVFKGNLEKAPSLVITERSSKLNAPMNIINEEVLFLRTELTEESTKVSFLTRDNEQVNLDLNMIGGVQADNAALAWLTLTKLLKPDKANKELIIKGLNQAKLPGRFEICRIRDPKISSKHGIKFIFDGAHTPVSIKHLLETWNKIYSKKGILIFGSVADKNPSEMARLLSPHFDNIIISTPGTFKESYPEDVYEIFNKYCKNVELMKGPVDAYNYALEQSGGNIPVLVTGSFYMVSEIRKLVMDKNY